MNKNSDLLANCVESRLNILIKGYFDKVSDKLNEFIFDIKKDDYDIIDSGCGPGFYMHRLKEFLNSKGKKSNISGFDISEPAIALAKKKFNDINFFCGDVNAIPVKDKSQSIITCVFSLKNYKEYNRILKNNGKVYIVTSGGKNHFKEILDQFGISKEKNFDKIENDIKTSGFKLNKKEFLEYKINLDSKNDIKEIIETIPYHLEFPQEKLNYFKALDKLELTLSFCFLEIEKMNEL